MTGAKRQSTTTPDSACTRELSRLLDEQVMLLERLDELGRRQRALAESEDPRPLDKLMDERQHLIEQLELLTVRVGPLRSQWEEESKPQSSGRDGVTGRLVRVSTLARQIAERDESDLREFASIRARIAEELARSRQGRRAAGAYAGTEQSRAGFQDYHA